MRTKTCLRGTTSIHHPSTMLRTDALCSWLSPAFAVTGAPVLVYLVKDLSSTTFPGDIQRWGTEGASSQRPLLLYQPCQSLTPPGASFDDYTYPSDSRQENASAAKAKSSGQTVKRVRLHFPVCQKASQSRARNTQKPAKPNPPAFELWTPLRTGAPTKRQNHSCTGKD